MIETLQYNLICFVLPVDGTTQVFYDNKSVVNNQSIPTSVLNKRHNAICYQRVREDQAAGILWVGWIPGEFNLVDLFTKTTMPGNSRHILVDSIFSNTSFHIGDIEKAQFRLYMGASKYLPQYKSSCRKWVLVLHISYSNLSINGCRFAGTR